MAGLSFSLAAAAEDGKIEILYVQAMGNSPIKVFPVKPGDKIEF